MAATCDYIEKYKFAVETHSYVETDGVIERASGGDVAVGFWKSISGLEKDIDINEFRTNGMPSVMKYPGFTRPGLVTMERAVYGQYPRANEETDQYYLRNWYYDVNDPSTGKGINAYYKDVYIYVLDRAGVPARLVTLEKAWPLKYTFPDLDAMDSEPGYEVIELRSKKISYEDISADWTKPYTNWAGDKS